MSFGVLGAGVGAGRCGIEGNTCVAFCILDGCMTGSDFDCFVLCVFFVLCSVGIFFFFFFLSFVASFSLLL